MTAESLTRRFVVLRALRWLPLGVGLPFFILLPQDRGIALGAIGVIWAVHSTLSLLLEVPSGALADAIGRRTTLLVGAALTAVGLAGYGVGAAVPSLMLAVAAIAIGRALISGSLEAWFVDTLRAIDPEAPLRRPLAAGTTAEALGMAAGSIAGGLLPLLATGLPERGDAILLELSVPFLAGAALALVYFGAIAAYVVEPSRERTTAWTAVAGEAMRVARSGLGAARRSHTVRRLLVIAAVIGLGLSTVELLWQPHLEDLLGHDASGSTPLFGALVAASMLAVAAGAWLSPRMTGDRGPRTTYPAAMVLLAVTLAVLGGAQEIVLFCVVYVLYYAALGFADPLHFELLHDAIVGPARATVVSAEALTSQIGAVGGNLVLVPLAAATSISVALTTCAVAALGGALLARSVRPLTPRRRPAAPSGAA